MVVKAQSPAAFAEKYIIDSIWSHHFPAGSLLPAERDLSEQIGVTRTTLREVLQRLAREGWLTIQHGKPTRVNNFWETAGLNILETIASLDHEGVPSLIENLLAVRMNIACIFMSQALRHHPDNAKKVIETALTSGQQAQSFTEIDFQLFRGLAFASDNPIYGLIINGLKGLYHQVGEQFFSDSRARALAMDFYRQLARHCNHETPKEKIIDIVRQYGRHSSELWHQIQHHTKSKE